MIVVADTSSLNYLVLTGRIDILPKLYDRIYIPESVIHELSDAGAPPAVQGWVKNLPVWVVTQRITNHDPSIGFLGRGEQDGMALIQTLRADLMLLDDKAARKAAIQRGISVIGILGIFRDAARAGLIDLEASIEALRQTNFHMSQSLVSEILNESRK